MKQGVNNQKDRMQKIFDLIDTKYSKKKIRCMIVFDQINSLARIYKKYNQTRLTYLDPHLQSKVILLTNVYKRGRDYQFNIFNSSNNIQPQLLDISTEQNLMTLCLNYHTKIQIVNCRYESKIFSNPINLKQLYRMVWYEISKKLSQDQIKQFENYHLKHVQTLKQNIQGNHMVWYCDELSKRYGFSSGITPLELKMVAKQIQINNNIKIEDLKVIMIQIISQVKQFGFQLLKEKCQRYFKDSDPEFMKNKLKVSLQTALLYQDALMLQESQKKQKIIYKTKQQQKQKIIPQIIKFSQLDLKGIKIQQIIKYVNRDVFQINKHQKHIRLIILREQFQKLKWKQMALTYKNFQEFIQEYPQALLKRSTGTLIQTAIIHYMQSCISNYLFMDGSGVFYIEGRSIFEHVNKQNNNFSMNFKKICETAKKINTPINLINLIPSEFQQQKNRKKHQPLVNQWILFWQGYDFISYDICTSKIISYVKNKFINAGETIKKIMQDLQNQQLKYQNQDNSQFILKVNSWQHRVISFQITDNLISFIQSMNDDQDYAKHNIKFINTKLKKLQWLIPANIKNIKCQIIRQNLNFLIAIVQK